MEINGMSLVHKGRASMLWRILQTRIPAPLSRRKVCCLFLEAQMKPRQSRSTKLKGPTGLGILHPFALGHGGGGGHGGGLTTTTQSPGSPGSHGGDAPRTPGMYTRATSSSSLEPMLSAPDMTMPPIRIHTGAWPSGSRPSLRQQATSRLGSHDGAAFVEDLMSPLPGLSESRLWA